jgi:hypothetical protein
MLVVAVGESPSALASRVKPAPSRAEPVPKCPADCVGPFSDCRFRAKGVFSWPQISGFGLCPGWLSDHEGPVQVESLGDWAK